MQKIFKLLVLSLLVFLCFNSFAQKKVIHTSELNTGFQVGYLPDVSGYILVDGEFINKLEKSFNPDPIEVYPNWPVNQTGSSNRGGIYCNLDDDPELEIVYYIGLKVYAWNIDGTAVTGWPASVSLYPDGAPAYGDIDGDGEGEVVVSGRNASGSVGSLYAFKKDGTSITGFPLPLAGGPTKTPVLADLDGDNVLEIIVEERDYPDGYVGAYYGDGTPFPGFPVALDYIPASAVAVGDINGDNIPEIVAESCYSVYAFDNAGNVLDGFPYTPGNDRVFSYSSPVLADLDGDGNREIIVGDHSLTAGNGAVHILKHDGTVFPGWPKYTGYWIYGPPSVGDIDGDGNLDIAVGDQVLSGSPADKVFVWDKDGNLLPGWPTPPMNAINVQILLVDLDGDGQIELMWDENTGDGNYIGYNHDGTPMEGWPLEVQESTFFMNPFATDINNDGILDLSGAGINVTSGNGYYYLWNVNEPYDETLSILPVLQYNVQHDGVYRDANVLNADFYASQVDICEGLTVQFSDQSTGNITSWEWTFEGGDPETSSGQNPMVLYENSGEFDVSLTISDGTNFNTTNKSNYIRVDYPVVVPTQPDGPTDVVTSQTPFTFYETSSENAEEYIWELSPNDVGVLIETDTLNQIKVFWSQANSYSAELRVKGVNACGESEFSEPLVIYVNWNTAISQQEENTVEVYPNPFSEKFFVKVGKPVETIQILITNGWGEIFLNRTMKTTVSSLLEIDLQNLSTGVYYGIFKMNEEIHMIKLIKL
ncbi:MAG: VCBS repeat-containing protein [Bacteroidales bacterium]|nr:VCBS repeat-containing protein [Bacteroidales bacterium]